MSGSMRTPSDHGGQATRQIVDLCQPRGEGPLTQLPRPANDTSALPPALLALLDGCLKAALELA